MSGPLVDSEIDNLQKDESSATRPPDSKPPLREGRRVRSALLVWRPFGRQVWYVIIVTRAHVGKRYNTMRRIDADWRIVRFVY